MKELNNRDCFIEKIILILSALARLIYVLGSTIYERQYDIGMISLDAGHTVSGGHLAYIQYLYENLRLPDMDPTTVYQFHHPPVHHYMCALWMRFLSLFIHNNAVLEESIQIVPFIFSLVALVYFYKILKEFEISGYVLRISLIIFGCHPAMILLSGSVNNDGTSFAFSMMVIYYFLRWIKDRSYKNIILTALFLGLGISTKQNVAYLAFPMAICFIGILVKDILEYRNNTIEIKSNVEQDVDAREGIIDADIEKSKGIGSVRTTILQYMCFGIISLPLGMWFYIRNLVKYNVSILWVYELPKDSWQYTGNIPVLYRFLYPVPSEMIDNLKHFKIGCGYNVWMQIMRTSVLGEWDMAAADKKIKVLAVLLMVTGAVIAIIAFMGFAGFIKDFVVDLYIAKTVNTDDVNSKKQDSALERNSGYRIQALFIILAYIITMIFYLIFVYKYPQECSMNFRYIATTIPFMLVILGKWGKIENTGLVKSGFSGLAVAFVILSVAMEIVWIKG